MVRSPVVSGGEVGCRCCFGSRSGRGGVDVASITSCGLGLVV